MDNEHNQKAAAVEVENYPLDDAAISMLAETQQQIEALTAARQGMLTYFVRLHKLTGNWRVAANGRELEKSPDQAAMLGVPPPPKQ
jgi:hypothetical protein